MEPKTVHSFLILGIIAGVSLTTFLFGFTNMDIRDLRAEVKADAESDNQHFLDLKEDVGFIKGVIQAWTEEGKPDYIP